MNIGELVDWGNWLKMWWTLHHHCFPWKNSVTTPFGRISKHLENWLLKNILKKKEIKHKKKSRCKDFSEDFKKKKKNETHLIPSSSHSLTSFLKLRIYEFACYLHTFRVHKNKLSFRKTSLKIFKHYKLKPSFPIIKDNKTGVRDKPPPCPHPLNFGRSINPNLI